MSFEIRRCKNGYVLFEGGLNFGNIGENRDPYVFETLDKALEFLRSKFTTVEITTGSKPFTKDK